MATVAGSTTSPNYLPSSGSISVRDVTFSSSYATGGELVALATIGLSSVYFAHANIKSVAGSATSVTFNPSTLRLLAYGAAGEIANATNLAGLTAEVVFFGKT